MPPLSHKLKQDANISAEIEGGYKNLFYGYERARTAREDGQDVCIVVDEDEVNALESLGFSAIAPVGGKWQQVHCEWVSDWWLILTLTPLSFRLQAGKLLDGYVKTLSVATDASNDNLQDYLTEHRADMEGAIERLMRGSHLYDYREELAELKTKIIAKPYEYVDPQSIPPREWLYGYSLLRKFVSTIVAPGGIGKSSLIAVEALAMVTGKRLLDVWTWPKCRVWLWNLEDDEMSMARTIQAACKVHGISKDDIAGRLYVNSGRDTPLCTAKVKSGEITILEPIYNEILEQLKARKIDVLVIDPFVSSHAVTENDNMAIDAVVKAWARVADAANCAILLVHHTRKENGGRITADSARGGGALIGAVRDCRTLNRMDEDEAKKLGVDNPRSYFKVQSDKGNFAPAETAQWYKFESVELHNDTKSRAGDSVGAVKRWYPKDPLDDVSEGMILQILARISKGDCRAHNSARKWAGHEIADILDRDTSDPMDKAFITRVLKVLLNSGRITVIHKQDKKTRKDRPYYSTSESVST